MAYPLKQVADHLATKGRYGDTVLMHVNPAEVRMMASLSPTGSLTINPDTGQPEAFLPMLAGLAGSVLGGLGASALGWSTALGAGLGSALATTIATGDVGRGILSGLMGYGLGGIGDAVLGAAGGSAAGEATKAATEAGINAAAPEMARTALDPAVMTSTSAIDHAIAGGPGGALGSIPGNTAMPSPGLGGVLDRFGSGLSNITAKDLGKSVFDNAPLIAAGGYGLASAPSDQGGAYMSAQTNYAPATTLGTGRKYTPKKPDPYGRENVYFEPVNFADGGSVEMFGDMYPSEIVQIERGRPGWRHLQDSAGAYLDALEENYPNERDKLRRLRSDDSDSTLDSMHRFRKSAYPMYKDGGEVPDYGAIAKQIIAMDDEQSAVPTKEEARRGMLDNPEEYLGEERDIGPDSHMPWRMWISDYGKEVETRDKFGRKLPIEQRYAGGRYVSGPGSGLDDAIPAIINGRQPAALSSGEYVIPARVVSGLGDGSSEAGVKKLDALVNQVMVANHGTTDPTFKAGVGKRSRSPKGLQAAVG